MPARLRGLLFGHGRMGRHHARKLRARADVSLQVVDPAQGLPAPARLAADFAVVATPTATHLEVARPLLRAGIPTLVEKPLAHSVEAAAALAAFPGCCVGHTERFNPALDHLWDAAPRWVQAERLTPFHGRGLDMDVLDDLMVHDADLALALLGGPAGEVRGSGVGVVTGTLDIVEARVALPGGVATLTASRVSRRPARTLRLVSDGCYWSVNLQDRTVVQVEWGQGALEGEPLPVAPDDPLERELDAFLAFVRGHAPFVVPGEQGLAALRLVAQVRAAVSSGPSAPPPG